MKNSLSCVAILLASLAFAEKAETRVSFVTPSIVRVTRSAEGQSLDKAWRVVTAGADGSVDVARTETADATVWKTAGLTVERAKGTGAFTFRDAAGNVLVREQGESRLKPAAQSFALAVGEPIYGLGDLQRPALDQRGVKHRLMPQNQGDGIACVVSPKGWALFWDDTSPVAFSEKDGTLRFESECAPFVDYYVIAGGSLDGCVKGMRTLTGPAPMLPIWTYGFWQSRERYKTQDEILGILRLYRQEGIPLDGIVQDWQYWGANVRWNDMAFDPATFPDAKAMTDEIHRLHAKVLVTVWPSFGPETAAFREFKEKNLLYPVDTWPLWVSDDDHTPSGARLHDAYNPVANDIYWKHLTRLIDLGFDGWWMDSTDPDHFEKPGDLDIPTSIGKTWREVRSAYPLACTEAVATRLRARDDKRPFILTRGACAGQQRCSASVWSGDVDSSWDALSYQIPGGLNYSLTGNPQFNCDLGGFFSGSWLPKGGVENEEWRELYTRWFELGTYLPMMRSHGTGVPRELHLYRRGPDDPVYGALLKAVKRRYALMPYLYSTAADVARNGTSFMRPLAADFPQDRAGWTVAQEFLFGRSLLVASVLQRGGKVEVYLPAGTDWWEVADETRHAGGTTLARKVALDVTPCYAKAGTILPVGPDVQWIGEKPWDDLEVRVYPGADGRFTLYEDDGETRACERGEFTEIDFTWNDAAKTLTVGKRRGAYPGALGKRRFRVRLVGGEGPAKSVAYAGEAVTVSF